MIDDVKGSPSCVCMNHILTNVKDQINSIKDFFFDYFPFS